MQTVRKSDKLWQQVYEILLQEIKSMKPGENRLPSEEELAEQLQVSRATVREAMQGLIRDGYLTRRHGKGNFVHPSAVHMQNRIDLTADFIELLSREGSTASCIQLKHSILPLQQIAVPYFPECLKLFSQTNLYQDGKEHPCIYCITLVPMENMEKEPMPTMGQRLEGWLEEFCGKDIAYYSTSLKCSMNKDVNECFSLPSDTWLQNWQEVVYDIYDEPVAFVDLYFHPENVPLSMVLKF